MQVTTYNLINYKATKSKIHILILLIALAIFSICAWLKIKNSEEKAPQDSHQDISVNKTPDNSKEKNPKVQIYSGGHTPLTQFSTKSSPLQKMRLQSVFDEALSSTGHAGLRVLAFYYSSACSSTESYINFSAEDLKGMFGGSAIISELTFSEMKKARDQQTEFCKTGNSSDFLTNLKQLKLSALGPVGRSIIGWDGVTRNQEYYQAVTQVIANPNVHSVQLDHWLSWDLHKQLLDTHALSTSQSIYIQDFLYNTLVTINNNNGFRLMHRCATIGACPSTFKLNDTELIRAREVAAQVLLAMQQQRWDLLIPQ